MAHALSTQPTNSIRNLTLAILVVWFLLAVAGSLLGVFDSEPRPPLPLGLAAVIPVALFAVCYLTSARFQELVWSLDLQLLTLAQTWRVGGIVFLVLYQHGALPGVFAIPAGWGDIAIGITAPIVAWYWRRPFPIQDFHRLECAGEPRLGDGGEPWGSRLSNPRGRLGRGRDHPTHGPVPFELDPDVFRAPTSDLASDLFEPCPKRTRLTEPSTSVIRRGCWWLSASAFCRESGS